MGNRNDKFLCSKKVPQLWKSYGKLRYSISFLCHRLPLCGKSMGLLPIGFPYIGKDMDTHTTQCTIGFPEVKIALP